MRKVLINNLAGKQEVLELGPGGRHLIPEAVLWDEAVDGPIDMTVVAQGLGGLKKVGQGLVIDSAMLADSVAAAAVEEAAKEAKRNKRAQIKAALQNVDNVTTVAQLRALVKALLQHLEVIE